MSTSFWLSIPEPSTELPTTLCGECGQRKINGMFLPEELKSGIPRCMACTGTIKSKPLWKRTKAAQQTRVRNARLSQGE